MTRIKLFMVVGAFMMGLIYFQLESAILLAAQLPATEVIAGIIVVLGTVGFALRYCQMKLAQAQNKPDL
jgi:protein-S-isoprenylcysteine O-methyltransferase Ste14